MHDYLNNFHIAFCICIGSGKITSILKVLFLREMFFHAQIFYDGPFNYFLFRAERTPEIVV